MITDRRKMTAISCSESHCTNVIWAPVKDTAAALRRVDWKWDGLAATCREHAADCPTTGRSASACEYFDHRTCPAPGHRGPVR